jgi:hydrogenase maturation protease
MKVASPLVVAIGNPDRGDDAVGLFVAQHLMIRRPARALIMEHSGESISLLQCLNGATCAYVIDACATSQPPGTITRFDVSAKPLPPDRFVCSTHGLGLADAIELARALGSLPRCCVVYAIEIRRLDIGAALSPEVTAAAKKAADLIWDELTRAFSGEVDTGSPSKNATE